MNTVVLIGRLARDPELRFTQSGKAVATFSIAVNRPFSKTNEADFFNIVVWGKVAESCANYLAKGRLVGIEGRLQSRSYESQKGEKRYVTEIVANQVEFLEYGKKEKTNNSNESDIELQDFQPVYGEDEGVPF
ncbi:single-stranded DNA-binding protein [Natronincola ferrireducens]|uniref:Single-stranded DNA-binding protein n=1 Tax=Natronincola ferrireducens TaxID=393762 RepID=A0A1G9I3P3_9FIRM|nr:single-stranded DNA-binding protein [Natronincola ferrireducens]SDL19675.1 single-strand binding protein [Natronincola ferrireducens]